MRAATAAAIRFLEERGTVAVGDVSNALGHLDLLSASRLSAVVYLELLSWDPAKAEAVLAFAEQRRAEVAASLRPGVEVRLAAHAPHSVSPALFRLLVGRGGPAALHLAESPDETAFLADGGGAWPGFLERRGLGHVAFAPPGLSPVRYADRLGALHPRLVAAHGVQLDAVDREILARGAACTWSSARAATATWAWARRRAGAPGRRVCASRSAPTAWRAPRRSTSWTTPCCCTGSSRRLDPAAIVRMATLGGAEALGLDDLGAIAPGKRAALAFAPASGAEADPHEFLLSGEARPRAGGGLR